jgi:hypothetical protein
MATKALKNGVRVRVRGTSPIAEDGEIYHPASEAKDKKGNLVKTPAAEFVTTQERAEALGDSVDILGPVVEEKPAKEAAK